MPYINQEARDELDEWLATMPKILTYGEYNYIITRMLISTKPCCYDDYQELVGLLECCKLELFRQPISRYEDKKKYENGDVYF